MNIQGDKQDFIDNVYKKAGCLCSPFFIFIEFVFGILQKITCGAKILLNK